MADQRQMADADADERSWMDLCADDEYAGRSHHRGRGPKHWSRDDQRIYEEICERLLHDPLIDARGIEVQVEDAVVTLSGEARAAADPVLAQQLVCGTPGVRGVILELAAPPRTMPAEPADDGRIDRSPPGPPIAPT